MMNASVTAVAEIIRGHNYLIQSFLCYRQEQAFIGSGGMEVERENHAVAVEHDHLLLVVEIEQVGHLLAEELLERVGITPVYQVDAKRLDVRMLVGESYHLACLTNIDTQERSVPAGKILTLCCGAENAKKVTFFTPDEEVELAFEKQGDALAITLPEIRQGGFIRIDE